MIIACSDSSTPLDLCSLVIVVHVVQIFLVRYPLKPWTNVVLHCDTFFFFCLFS